MTVAAPAQPRVAQRIVKRAARAADRVRRPSRGLVVLIYHRVGAGSGLAVDLDPGAFDDQMAWLAASGRATTLDDGLARVAGAPGAADADPIVVTFDDGTADIAEVALPILARHGIPALLYLATDFVDTGREFPDAGRPLSWAAVRDLVASGVVEIGSHTHTHALLDRLAPEAIADELDRSVTLVHERVGCPVRHFAYPKALAPTPDADRAVRARFASAALAGTRPNRFGATDPWALSRSPIQTADGFDYFVAKAMGGMQLEDTARRLVNRVRYAGATQ